jgi:hypothetical protein
MPRKGHSEEQQRFEPPGREVPSPIIRSNILADLHLVHLTATRATARLRQDKGWLN